jgi:hypothetical protein
MVVPIVVMGPDTGGGLTRLPETRHVRDAVNRILCHRAGLAYRESWLKRTKMVKKRANSQCSNGRNRNGASGPVYANPPAIIPAG